MNVRLGDRATVSVRTELLIKQKMSWEEMVCGDNGLSEDALGVLMGANKYLAEQASDDELELPRRLAESLTEAICAAEALGL